MNRTDALYPNEIINICNTLSENISSDNEAILTVLGSVKKILEEENLTSITFTKLKKYMADYELIVKAIKDANEIDLLDLNNLKKLVDEKFFKQGDTIWLDPYIIGEHIFESLDIINEHKKERELLQVQGQFEIENSHDDNIEKNCNFEISLFDSIEENTKNLFIATKNARQNVIGLIKQMIAAYDINTGEYSYQAYSEYRNNILKFENNVHGKFDAAYNKALNDLLKKNGPFEIDMEAVKELLSKDASEISGPEYKALAYVMCKMNDRQLTELVKKLCSLDEKGKCIDQKVIENIISYLGVLAKDELNQIQYMGKGSTNQYDKICLMQTIIFTISDIHDLERTKLDYFLIFPKADNIQKPDIDIIFNDDGTVTIRYDRQDEIQVDESWPGIERLGKNELTISKSPSYSLLKDYVDDIERPFRIKLIGDINNLELISALQFNTAAFWGSVVTTAVGGEIPTAASTVITWSAYAIDTAKNLYCYNEEKKEPDPNMQKSNDIDSGADKAWLLEKMGYTGYTVTGGVDGNEQYYFAGETTSARLNGFKEIFWDAYSSEPFSQSKFEEEIPQIAEYVDNIKNSKLNTWEMDKIINALNEDMLETIEKIDLSSDKILKLYDTLSNYSLKKWDRDEFIEGLSGDKNDEN